MGERSSGKGRAGVGSLGKVGRMRIWGHLTQHGLREW